MLPLLPQQSLLLLVVVLVITSGAMLHLRTSIRGLKGIRTSRNAAAATTRLFTSTQNAPTSSSSARTYRQLSTLPGGPLVLDESLFPAPGGSAHHGVSSSSQPQSQPLQYEEIESLSKIDPENKFSEFVTVVRDRVRAREIVKIMESPKYADIVWACDTETEGVDPTKESPVGKGEVICVSIYGGPGVDFGSGPGTALWIENIQDAAGVLQEFKGWFESPKHKKVWHNYGFDRHVINNEGIDVQGFFGDTMHMARLNDTSREKVFGAGKGYGLESLSADFVDDPRFQKKSMKDLFGIGKLKKDGTEGRVLETPSNFDKQLNPNSRDSWIEYSAKDAIATWIIWSKLEQSLKKQEWRVGVEGRQKGSMYDFYQNYLKDFGDLLTVMESNGIRVDTDSHLAKAEVAARLERDKMEKIFLEWAAQYTPNAKYINTGSSAQLGQFLFGDVKINKLNEKEQIAPRTFKVDKEDDELAAEASEAISANPYVNHKVADLKALLKERGLRLTGKKVELMQRLVDHDANPFDFDKVSLETLQDICASRNFPDCTGDKETLAARLKADSEYSREMNQEKDRAEAAKKKVETKTTKKYRELSFLAEGGPLLDPVEVTPTGTPQVTAAILKKLAGSNVFAEDEKDFVPGKAYEKFAIKSKEDGRRACQAIGALANIGQIDATITNFLVPLQTLVDKNKRIHCSLNLNTETGRLSSRRPNLQNQPALEKDQYKIRDAFVAEPGCTLIVADYGQLELRLLAHMTECKSMLDAFAGGGCFHSRTAVGMYDYVKEAVDSGKVLLEWDYSKGQPTVPLVKDTYASERRKAKTLNFSIAYGKTVHGLAQDWGISTDEAQETLEAWYRDRPEVKVWQDKQRKQARKEGFVRTLMGRKRLLPDARKNGPYQGHALRAAINTPIQGSAADVVMMAMIKLWRSEVLTKLGWRLLLQIHDEVILEGPKESAKEALAEVRACMEDPFDDHGLERLSVFLDVDAKSADTWYRAK